ncbi:HAAS domain-containing protein [Risungbinella massiliensis]|uniref:HAAS domain-containing protein n=1 Tax=Risungbinella massiliensis TaxID=1329796 RepID=UPI00069A985C|nr:hypothetical protein [Risungbinella massiliensis]
MKLSTESEEFLENLRLYLFSSGKKTDEIEGIVEELKDHLWEAEKNGKSVSHIIGESPQHYMEHISKELRTDYKGWLKLLPVFIIGVFAYVLLGDAINNTIGYSLYDIIGYPFICLFMLGVIKVSFQHLAKTNLSKITQYSIYFGIAFLSLSMFIGVILLDRNYGTSLFQLDTFAGRMIVAVIAAVILITISIWSKTWVSIILPIIVYSPTIITDLLPVQYETKLLLSSLFTLIGFLLFLIIQFKMLSYHNQKK